MQQDNLTCNSVKFMLLLPVKVYALNIINYGQFGIGELGGCLVPTAGRVPMTLKLHYHS